MTEATELIELPETVAVPQGDYALIAQATRWRELVEGYLIDSPAMFEAAGEDLRNVKGLRAQIDDERTRLKAPVLTAGRAIDDFFRRPLTMLDEAARTLTGCMGKYQAEQERIAAQKRREAEELAAAERKRALEQAAALEAEGRFEQAEQVQAQAEFAIAPAVAVNVPKVAGVSARKTWKLDDENIDMKALVKFVAANCDSNPAVLEYVCANTTMLNTLAKAHRKVDFGVPGVKAIEVIGYAARR